MSATGKVASWVAAIAFVALAAAAAQQLETGLLLSDPALILLVGVLLSAIVGGLGPSLFASGLGFLAYNYFFVEPRFTLGVTKPQDVVSLVVFLAVAVVTSTLMSRLRNEAANARAREARTAALYEFARELVRAHGLDDLLPIIAAQLGRLFRARVVVLVPRGGRLAACAAFPPDATLTPAELEAAESAWLQAGVEAAVQDRQPDSGWVHVSTSTARGEAAVFSLDLRGAPALGADQLQLLDTLAHQAALAIERCGIDAVLEEKAKTEQVIEASEDGLFVLDGDGRVVHVNDVACVIFDVERAHILERPFDELGSRQPHYLRVREAVREALADPARAAHRIEITVFLRGRDHHYVLRQTPFHARDGAKPGLLLALQDVTYVRDQEARRENLVATLSHELRTPLTSLRMAIELLRERTDAQTPETRELVEASHEDVLRLQDVSQQFLDLARTRAMAIGVQRRRFDVHRLVGRMLRLFAIQAKEKNVALAVSEDLVAPLMGDETKLSWALSNLIANAIRYTPPGGTVRIETGTRDHVVTVSVADSGPGIALEEQGRIFERYAQGAGESEGAAGLGLSIVRDIVQAHGGRIHLDSAPGKGTRFTLELPAE